MKGKKLLLSKLLHYSGINKMMLSHDFLYVFGYHRIKSLGWRGTDFDDGVFGPDVETFQGQVKWLVRNTCVLSLDDLLERIHARNFAGGPFSMITFDDGYEDNYGLAFPVLRNEGAPAIFFLPSGQMETRCLGWWDIISYLIKKCSKDTFELYGEVYTFAQGQEAIIRALLRKIKTEPAQRTVTLLKDLSVAAGIALPSIEEQGRQIMTWAQAREMSESGMILGSHTHSHRVLSTLEAHLQEREMSESKSVIQERTGCDIKAIAFPVGGPAHYNPDSIRLAKKCGYEAAFSFDTGCVAITDVDVSNIPRLSAPSSVGMISSICAFPNMMRSGARKE